MSKIGAIYQSRVYGSLLKVNRNAFNRKSYATNKNEWKTVVGLEIHAQIASNSKLFSGAKCEFAGLVNNSVAMFDAAIPGTLPVLNRRCVEAGVLAAVALGCKINPVSTFDRKHYFYADLPSGYQITQQRLPLAQDGQLEFDVFHPKFQTKRYKKVSKIKQIQLEQDSGKSLRDDESNQSLIDLNRAGIPLMELVFEPDLESGEEAASLVKELILILERTGCSSCRMQEGALRVDANVSVHRPGEPFGTRTELKNIGSIRAIAAAIKYESERQISTLNSGGTIYNETLSWDPLAKKAIPMRDKEITQDYRYMPEPNLPPLRLNMTKTPHPDFVSVPLIAMNLPEMPEETRQRLMTEYNFSRDFAVQIVNEKVLSNYFWKLVEDKNRTPKTIAVILLIELLGVLHRNNIPIEDCDLPIEYIGEIIDMKENSEISLGIVKKILDVLLLESKKDSPIAIVNKNNWKLINTDSEIEQICVKAIEDNPELVKKGKKNIVNQLAKIIDKSTDQRANMGKVVKKLEELLKKQM